jgi:hypothetical protein
VDSNLRFPNISSRCGATSLTGSTANTIYAVFPVTIHPRRTGRQHVLMMLETAVSSNDRPTIIDRRRGADQVNLSRSEKPEAGCAITLPPLHSAIRSSLRPERSVALIRDEMALKVEGVVDGGMHAEKALGGSSRFEPLHLALSSPYGLMRILGTIVFPEPLFMRAGQL